MFGNKLAQCVFLIMVVTVSLFGTVAVATFSVELKESHAKHVLLTASNYANSSRIK